MVPTRYGKQFANIYNNVELEILDGYDHEFTQNMPAVADKVTEFIVEGDQNNEEHVIHGQIALSWWERFKSWVYTVFISFI